MVGNSGSKLNTHPRFSARHLILFLLAVALLLVSIRFAPQILVLFDTDPPVINVWYGSHQVFGHAGLSQRWVNVLGNAADPQGKITNLSYRLNGSPAVKIRLGPDGRRLTRTGDFNIEIDPANLHNGDNALAIEATDGKGLRSTTTVTVTFQRNVIQPPFQIDWSKVRNPQEVLQIVDGKWRWDANGIRPAEMGYDRFLTIGDTSWTDFEVTVPVTVHGMDAAAFNSREGGNHAGISVDLRWLGHSDDPLQCPPPHCGWNPVGDFNKYFFIKDGADFLGLKVQEKEQGFPTIPYKVQPGHTYVFKASVKTTPQGNEYRMKVWEKDVESEPANWMFQRLGQPGNPSNGAFSLVAHFSDVTFGNVSVTPVR